MDNQEPFSGAVIICGPWTPKYENRMDAAKMQCAACGVDVVTMASNRARILKENIATICIPCGAAYAQAADEMGHTLEYRGFMIGGKSEVDKANEN